MGSSPDDERLAHMWEKVAAEQEGGDVSWSEEEKQFLKAQQEHTSRIIAAIAGAGFIGMGEGGTGASTVFTPPPDVIEWHGRNGAHLVYDPDRDRWEAPPSVTSGTNVLAWGPGPHAGGGGGGGEYANTVGRAFQRELEPYKPVGPPVAQGIPQHIVTAPATYGPPPDPDPDTYAKARDRYIRFGLAADKAAMLGLVEPLPPLEAPPEALPAPERARVRLPYGSWPLIVSGGLVAGVGVYAAVWAIFTALGWW